MTYEFISLFGIEHLFTTDEIDGVYYKYRFKPEVSKHKYMNFLEIEKFVNGILHEMIMISKKQLVFTNIRNNFKWQYMFETGNKYEFHKHFTKKEGSEWKVLKDIKAKSITVNLEYDVKSSIIEHCLNLVKSTTHPRHRR